MHSRSIRRNFRAIKRAVTLKGTVLLLLKCSPLYFRAIKRAVTLKAVAIIDYHSARLNFRAIKRAVTLKVMASPQREKPRGISAPSNARSH
ncbi:MAG: hypothetical protein M2R45_00430 [Verrucomicrobia subdivision 3 bacterium]|nr:hypothetical protein [Limisphaerales bacterium]MCS1413690.1 hypothetical protein [Limisphaerales bacterium]